MTVASETSRNDYVGTGVTPTYSYTFRIFAATDLRVTEVDPAGVETTLVYLTDYTVTGVGSFSGGTITLTAGNLTSGHGLTIRFRSTLTQQTDIRNQSGFFPEVIEDALDRSMKVDQQQQDELNRSLRLPETEAGTAAARTLPTLAQRASKYSAWDASGNPMAAAAAQSGTPVSAFMVTVLDDATSNAALTTLTATRAETGAVAVSVLSKLRESISVKDFGAVGDGVADDTTALVNAISAAVAANATLWIGAGTYKVTSAALAINATGVRIHGAGVENTIIKASGNFAQILELQASSGEVFISDITFDQTGTTTRCVKITRGQTPHFENCGFRGNLNGTLVFSTGDICYFERSKFDADSANTQALEFDEFNQNCHVTSSRFGGVGKGIKVSRSGANARVEGLKVADCVFINTGTSNIEVGNSFLTTVTGCVLDQASTVGVLVSGGADKLLIDGNWIGLAGAAGNAVQFNADSGGGHIVSNNQVYGGAIGIVVGASVTARVAGVVIDGNVFDNMATAALQLDSVNGCTIVNNIDRTAAPASGSWVTTGTHASGGDYTFDNNRWSTAAQAALHATSSYLYGDELGLVNTGWTAYTPVVTAGSGTITTVGAVIGRYIKRGKTVHFFANCTITTNGTGATFVAITLPSTARTAAGTYVGAVDGLEPAVANVKLFGRINSADNKAQCFKFDGTYPGANNAQLIISGTYEE